MTLCSKPWLYALSYDSIMALSHGSIIKLYHIVLSYIAPSHITPSHMALLYLFLYLSGSHRATCTQQPAHNTTPTTPSAYHPRSSSGTSYLSPPVPRFTYINPTSASLSLLSSPVFDYEFKT